MSRIYFHTIDDCDDATVRGSERAHFGIICSDIAWSVVRNLADEWSDRPSILRNAFPVGHYALTSGKFSESAALHFRVGNEPLILAGEKINMFPLILNTAYFMGSDPVRLGARLHGQCELHAYVEGKNRKWLANIIRQGRKFKFLRDDMGWESVIELLERGDDSPIVTSYSVCEQFPNSHVADYDHPELDDGELDYDAWYDLPHDEQWELAIRGLRESSNGLEIKPDNWNDFYFSNGFDANQLVSKLYELFSNPQNV